MIICRLARSLQRIRGAGVLNGGRWAIRLIRSLRGKNGDTESRLDYFGARYYGSALGRFTSPDPLRWLEWQRGTEEMQDRFRLSVQPTGVEHVRLLKTAH